MIKFTHHIYMESENNKCYVKNISWKVFKNSIKLLTSPFLVMLQTFFYSMSTQREIVHSKDTWRAFEHSKGTWALSHSNHLCAWTLEHLRHSGTQRALRHSGTWALRHSDTWALEVLEALCLADTSRSLSKNMGNMYFSLTNQIAHIFTC